MGFGFKLPLVWEKRCVMTLITAAEETRALWEINTLEVANQSTHCTGYKHKPYNKFT